MNLDEYQKLAAEQDNHYSVIIAGAGTGKTYTLLGRIQYLVNEKGLLPEEIIVISYTNETVKDFLKKCKSLLGFEVMVMTFHKLAIYLLNLADISFQLCSQDFLSYITHEFFSSICQQNSTLNNALKRSLPVFSKFSKKALCIWKNKISDQTIKFIYLCQSKEITKNSIKKLIHKNFGRKKYFFLLAYLAFGIYESEKESQCLMDFDDIILKAGEALNDFNMELFPFKHILVDEFQDSSIARIHLFQLLVQKFSMDFTAVGDDCQSIYRFSGTESNCFQLLELIFPNLKFFFLKRTYRNSQELIHVAESFVQKNKRQIKKNVISNNHLKYPIEIFYYYNTKTIYKMITYILKEHINSNILFLGRYSFDWKYYFDKHEIHWIDKTHFSLNRFPNVSFSYLTIHQSKGLEADIVILLHLEKSKYGFPSQVKPYFFEKILLEEDQILFEEERRLFYVALTRTKNKIYLVTPIRFSSVFIKEIYQDNCKQILKKYFF